MQKKPQPDQEWKNDVNDHAFLFPYFPSTVEPVFSGHLVLTLKLPRSDYKFSPLAATHFLVNKSQESGVRSILLTSIW